MATRAPIIDPTTNVLDLVAAAMRRQDDLREAQAKFDAAMRDAETRRIDQLAAQRVHYDGLIEGMRTNSLQLLAEQLKENKAETSGRTSLLEQFRWESGGKGLGVSALAGWIFSAVVALVAAATYFKH